LNYIGMNSELPEKEKAQNGATLITFAFLFLPTFQHHELLKPHKTLIKPGIFGELPLSRRSTVGHWFPRSRFSFGFFFGCLFGGIIEHGCAHAIFAILAHQDFVVDAALAT